MSPEPAHDLDGHRAGAAAGKTEKRRGGRVAVVAVAIALVAALIVLLVVVTRPSATTAGASSRTSTQQILPAASSGSATIEAPVTRVADTSGISGVLAWQTAGLPGDGSGHPGALDHKHVTTPVAYAVLPPVGGPHNLIWMNAGVYTKPVPTERAVHNLEHGAVWITYNPGLSAADIAQLTAFVTRQSLIAEPAGEVHVAGDSNRYIDLSPWATASLPSPIVISSWGHQLWVTSPTDPRLQQFVDTFRHSRTYSPEFGAAVDGIPVLTGGRPALDGGTKPNPPGSAR